MHQKFVWPQSNVATSQHRMTNLKSWFAEKRGDDSVASQRWQWFLGPHIFCSYQLSGLFLDLWLLTVICYIYRHLVLELIILYKKNCNYIARIVRRLKEWNRFFFTSIKNIYQYYKNTKQLLTQCKNAFPSQFRIPWKFYKSDYRDKYINNTF